MKKITEDDRSKARLCWQMAGRLFEEGRDYAGVNPQQFCDILNNEKFDTEMLSFVERDIAELFPLELKEINQ